MPQEPGPEDCCQNGCTRCVWSSYAEELQAWKEEVARLESGAAGAGKRPEVGTSVGMAAFAEVEGLTAFAELERRLQQQQEQKQQEQKQQEQKQQESKETAGQPQITGGAAAQPGKG